MEAGLPAPIVTPNASSAVAPAARPVV